MANQNLSATIAIGGIVAHSLLQAFGKTQNGIKQIGGCIKDLKKRREELNKRISEYDNNEKKHLMWRFRAAEAELNDLNRKIKKHEKINDLLRKEIVYANKTAVARLKAGNAYGALYMMSRPVVGSIHQAASLETASMGVARQLEGARDSTGKLTKEFFAMHDEIMAKAREVPIATEELFGMYEAGLKQGIDKKVVGSFVDSVSQISVALDLSKEETARHIGVISNLYKRPITSINELGDAINFLDDKYLSSAGGIIDYMTRIGGTAASFGVADKQAAALGSTFETLGSNIEAAATSTRAIFTNLGAADKIKKVGKGLAALGLSSKDVQVGMTKDAVGTLLTVLDRINALPKEKQTGVLYELFGKEHIGNAQKLAQNVDLLREQLAAADSEAAKGSALREYKNILGTANSQLAITKNRVTELSAGIGSALLPSLNGFLGLLNPVVTKVAVFAKNNPILTQTVVGVVGSLLGMSLAFHGLSLATFKFLQIGYSTVNFFIGLPGMIGKVGSAMRALSLIFTTTPIGAVIMGIALGATLVIAYWDEVGSFFKRLWEGIKIVFGGAYDFIVGKIQTMLGLLSKVGLATSSAFGGESVGITSEGYKGFHRGDLPTPAMATARSGNMVNDNSQNTINIYQQPGQDSKALAAEIEKQRKQRAGVAARSSYADGSGL